MYLRTLGLQMAQSSCYSHFFPKVGSIYILRYLGLVSVRANQILVPEVEFSSSSDYKS